MAPLQNEETEPRRKQDAAEIQLNICFDKLQRESFCGGECVAAKWFSLFEAATLLGRVGFLTVFPKSCFLFAV